MAYTIIPDAEIEPGKPGSGELFTKLRDNPEAIALGLAGAPKIVNNAFNDASLSDAKLVNVSNGKLIDNNIQLTKLQNIVTDSVIVATKVIAKGIYIVTSTDGDAQIQLQNVLGWFNVDDGLVVSDGVNARILVTNGSALLRRIF